MKLRDDSLILQLGHSPRSWKVVTYKSHRAVLSTPSDGRPCFSPEGPGYSEVKALFNALAGVKAASHQPDYALINNRVRMNGEAVTYLDSKGRRKRLDGMVSVSRSPTKAEYFGRLLDENPSPFRFTVFSVPKSEIRAGCIEGNLPRPGTIVEPYHCGITNSYFTTENEMDAYLYVNPEYVFKDFAIQRGK